MKTYDPAQPRDDHGRFSSSSGRSFHSVTNAPSTASIAKYKEEIGNRISEIVESGNDSPDNPEFDSLAHIDTVLDQVSGIKLSEKKDWRFAFAEDANGGLVAAGSINRLDKKTAEVKNVGSVARGAGSAVVNQLIKDAKPWGISKIVLQSTARAFYEKLGFSYNDSTHMMEMRLSKSINQAIEIIVADSTSKQRKMLIAILDEWRINAPR